MAQRGTARLWVFAYSFGYHARNDRFDCARLLFALILKGRDLFPNDTGVFRLASDIVATVSWEPKVGQLSEIYASSWNGRMFWLGRDDRGSGLDGKSGERGARRV